MTKNEFIEKMMFKPWVARAIGWQAVDCYGLIVMYYRHVLNIELPIPQGFYDEDDTRANSWFEGVKHWQDVKTPSADNIIFTAYIGDKPAHVGLCIGDNKVLHARGTRNVGGCVEIHSLSAIERLYGKLTYHKFIGDK